MEKDGGGKFNVISIEEMVPSFALRMFGEGIAKVVEEGERLSNFSHDKYGNEINESYLESYFGNPFIYYAFAKGDAFPDMYMFCTEEYETEEGVWYIAVAPGA